MNIEDEVANFKKHVATMSQEESIRHHLNQQRAYETEHKAFLNAYNEDKCYMCGKPFASISSNQACLHWLLRRCKFKKKDFEKEQQALMKLNEEWKTQAAVLSESARMKKQQEFQEKFLAAQQSEKEFNNEVRHDVERSNPRCKFEEQQADCYEQHEQLCHNAPLFNRNEYPR